jgi:ABC-2 type transport system ATP-binding protein
MEDVVISAENLTKRYGSATVVDGVSFGIRRGEIFGLLGPNGAGKTTTILMLLGLSEITGGKARVLGRDPAREPLTVKRQVGYLPDNVGFYDNLTGIDNLHYTARLIGIPHEQRARRIAEALERAGLADAGRKKVGAYSHGMRQRLGLAEIVMKEARVAILDEPTNGLDPQASVELLALIRALKEGGVTVMLSSHLLDRVQSVCDRVALFNAGRIALMGSVAALGRQVLGGGFAVEVEATGGVDLHRRLASLPGVQKVTAQGDRFYRLLCDRDLRSEAAAEVLAAGGALLRLGLDSPSLEQIYTRYFEDAARQAEEVRHAA